MQSVGVLERGETALPPCFSTLFLYGEIEKQERTKENESEGNPRCDDVERLLLRRAFGLQHGGGGGLALQ